MKECVLALINVLPLPLFLPPPLNWLMTRSRRAALFQQSARQIRIS